MFYNTHFGSTNRCIKQRLFQPQCCIWSFEQPMIWTKQVSCRWVGRLAELEIIKGFNPHRISGLKQYPTETYSKNCGNSTVRAWQSANIQQCCYILIKYQRRFLTDKYADIYNRMLRHDSSMRTSSPLCSHHPQWQEQIMVSSEWNARSRAPRKISAEPSQWACVIKGSLVETYAFVLSGIIATRLATADGTMFDAHPIRLLLIACYETSFNSQP